MCFFHALNIPNAHAINTWLAEQEREAFSQLYSSLPALAAGQDGGLAMSKAGAAVPTRKAAMEIEAGGGVDVREGQASVSCRVYVAGWGWSGFKHAVRCCW
ncbi:unnamed protein product [Ectocarpus sp. 12 AP-2014]